MARRTAAPPKAAPRPSASGTAPGTAGRPSPKRDALIAQAEDLFDRFGFHGTGVDRLVSESGVARMTFYKHFPTKHALIRAVLEHRDARYWAHMDAASARLVEGGGHPVLAVFEALAEWLDGPGSHGDLLLKAMGEFAGHDVAVAGDAAFRKKKAGPWMRQRLEAAGVADAEARCWDLVLLMDGAAALAPVVGGAAAAGQAAHAAAALLDAWAARDGAGNQAGTTA